MISCYVSSSSSDIERVESIASAILKQQFGLDISLKLPPGVEYLYPYVSEDVRHVMSAFYNKYFQDDNRERIIIAGINPGRFGAGITGIPFTDPIRLEEQCGISNPFQKRQELSSAFVFDVIHALGGLERFYSSIYITSICPLGFVKNGKNYNYYDDAKLQKAVYPLIKNNFDDLMNIGFRRDVAFSMGKGKNFKFLQKFNAEHNYFERVLPLPHPRWVMQYRLKRKEEFVEEYVTALATAIDSKPH